MDFLTLASLCGPGVDPVTTAAIIKTESNFEPLAIRDNTLQVSFKPTSRAAAESTLSELVRRGDKLAIGLMQITTPWVTKFGIKAADLLNGCTNIRYGTHILSENFKGCQPRSSDDKTALECALSTYWSGNGTVGGAYVNQVYLRSGSVHRVHETPGITYGVLRSGATKKTKPRSPERLHAPAPIYTIA